MQVGIVVPHDVVDEGVVGGAEGRAGAVVAHYVAVDGFAVCGKG